MLADGTDSNVFRCCSHQASRGVALLFPSRRFSSKTAGSSGYGVCRRLVHARDVTNGASNVKKNMMKCVHLRVKSDPGGKQVNCFTSKGSRSTKCSPSPLILFESNGMNGVL